MVCRSRMSYAFQTFTTRKMRFAYLADPSYLGIGCSRLSLRFFPLVVPRETMFHTGKCFAGRAYLSQGGKTKALLFGFSFESMPFCGFTFGNFDWRPLTLCVACWMKKVQHG